MFACPKLCYRRSPHRGARRTKSAPIIPTDLGRRQPQMQIISVVFELVCRSYDDGSHHLSSVLATGA
jgi:hypothetical protein